MRNKEPTHTGMLELDSLAGMTALVRTYTLPGYAHTDRRINQGMNSLLSGRSAHLVCSLPSGIDRLPIRALPSSY